MSEESIARLMALVSDQDVLELMREIGTDAEGFVPYRGTPDSFAASLFGQIQDTNMLTDQQISAARAIILPRNWFAVRALVTIDRIPVTEGQIITARTAGVTRPRHIPLNSAANRGRPNITQGRTPRPARQPVAAQTARPGAYVERRQDQGDLLPGLAAAQAEVNATGQAIRSQQPRTPRPASPLSTEAIQAKVAREAAARAYKQRLADAEAAAEREKLEAVDNAAIERFKRLELDDYAPIPLPEDKAGLERARLVMRELDGPLPSVRPPGKTRGK